MNKTLHKKLTEKHHLPHTHSQSAWDGDGFFAHTGTEKGILEALSGDLLQPRPQAIANILKMAKSL